MAQKRNVRDVLIINSYAGSLTIAADALGLKIRGSYEDAGFGIEAQKLNFPDLTYVDKLPWPKDDLSKTIAIAHPPCAPFSNMSTAAQGTQAEGFQCHRDVMDYTLAAGTQALAIESVPGVMKAAHEYEAAAKKYGYSHYFIKLNSIGFGVPQWRPRIWVIFLKGPQKLRVNYKPVYKPLSSFLVETGTAIERGVETHIIIRRMKEAGVKGSVLKRIFEGEHGSGSILQIGGKMLELEDVGTNFVNVRKAWNLGGLFAAMMPRILDETRWAPTVLGGCAWFIHGRPLFLEEYNAIMGFPVDYKWPENFTDPRLYLSKGVCPPVARWILDMMYGSVLGTIIKDNVTQEATLSGDIIDLSVKKAEVENILDGKPAAAPRVKKARGAKSSEPYQRVTRSAADQYKNFTDQLGDDE